MKFQATLLSLALCLCSSIAFGQIVDKKNLIEKNASLEKVADGFGFTEGPAVTRLGDVYFSDQPNNKIFKWSFFTNKTELFKENAGRSNGMFVDKDGKIIACADEKNQIWRIDEDGSHEVIIESFQGKKLNGPNDLFITPSGTMYVTDPLYKRDYWTREAVSEQGGEHLYLVSADRLQIFKVDENLVKPNGIVGTYDGKTLYVADIEANKTYKYDIIEDGFLTNRQLFTERGSDGMTIDVKGNLYLTGDKGVWIYNRKGEEIGHIPVPEKWTANVVFAGPDRKTLFITASEAVYKIRMKVHGTY
ncbi:SMP-30/gluconolactonase/LRE family protein [Belliella kenyensis]|uniref:SMP-30/gluconolactonase/LRE family protein n=1 Tax=Belliella kenyensis TaxID=1472724 RepID=A0ABV8EKT2_9BACT|nr:SMP-30/gluconolactonase/LRE family protein [Belliella kenyensis]MCH7400260.1 SMP-30/gluconolactonase/LRE family protein [Belliella kenyensis]MDN3604723.1 SMP-30/gluconolactonase/LRE family protein [Belliella kenyensis]